MIAHVRKAVDRVMQVRAELRLAKAQARGTEREQELAEILRALNEPVEALKKLEEDLWRH